MFKKIILICMGLFCLYMFSTTMIKIYNVLSEDILIQKSCTGEIIMTCGEYGCEDLCYPVGLH